MCETASGPYRVEDIIDSAKQLDISGWTIWGENLASAAPPASAPELQSNQTNLNAVVPLLVPTALSLFCAIFVVVLVICLVVCSRQTTNPFEEGGGTPLSLLT